MSKRIFIAATCQNDGKTTVAVGLIFALKRYFKHIGFIKPIGQRYLVEGGYKVDEDSVLIEHICKIHCRLPDMSPIAVERGFTEKYISAGGQQNPALVRKIKKSFTQVARGNELVIIEGTGHAGVGSVFDMSNAVVAKMLGSKVIIVASGGIGRPIDEIMLNCALFEKQGVEVAGIIINKVLDAKFKKISRLVRRGLELKGLKVLGVIPYRKLLTAPTMRELKTELDAEILCGYKNLDRLISKIVVGAMSPHNMLGYLKPGSLLITPGDREDNILVALEHNSAREKTPVISGIILSGGIRPHQRILDLACKSGVPILLMQPDTYRVAALVHDLTVKVRPRDTAKIKVIRKLIENYVDIKSLKNIIMS